MEPTAYSSGSKNKLPFIIGGGLVLIVIVIFSLIILKAKGTVTPGIAYVSPNILYITQPVNAFSGNIDKIEGNTLTVSNQYNSPSIQKLTYKVLVSGNTQISSYPTSANSLERLPAGKQTVKDLKIGQSISVTSKVDLRTLSSDSFEAVSIIINNVTSLDGTVSDISGNTIILKAVSFNPASPDTRELKDFQITVSENTQIYKIIPVSDATPNPPPPEKISFSDVKKGMQITVFTDTSPLSSTQLKALKINVVENIPRK